MSALARWFRINGYTVAGYDRTPTALTDALQAEGIAIHFTEDVAQIPAANSGSSYRNARRCLVCWRAK